MKSSTTRLFENIYTRINVLDYDSANKTFNQSGTLFLIGDASDHVKKIDDITIKNKKLVSAIGLSAVKLLSQESKRINGGDIDWDDLDELDLEELLNEEVNVSKPLKTQKSEASSFKDTVISNMQIYTTDKISDIHDKIATITKIKPYKQYLWASDVHKSLNGMTISLMSHWSNGLSMIDGYPTNQYLEVNLLDDDIRQFTVDSTLVLTLINLDSILYNKEKLNFIARSDSESYELIHSYAISPFFPMITLPVFNQILLNEDEVETKFPSYYFNVSEVSKMLQKQSQILNSMSSPSKQKTKVDSTITASAIDVLLYSSLGSDQYVDTIRLFKRIKLADIAELNAIELYYTKDYKSYKVQKVPSRNQFNRITSDCSYNKSCNNKSLAYEQMISFIFLPSDLYASMSLNINKFGSIWIKGKPVSGTTVSKEVFIDQFKRIVNKLINQINAYNLIFTTSSRFKRLDTVLSYNLYSSSSRLHFKNSLHYRKFIDITINALLESGFLKYAKEEESVYQKTKNEFTLDIAYGVSRESKNTSSIVIRNSANLAIVDLINLDIGETTFYIGLLNYMIIKSLPKLITDDLDNVKLQVVDPILFRPSIQSDLYSRLCQRKFQPVITNKSDPKGNEYYNFTFNRPEYYKCPHKDISVFGLIQNKHEKGYCIPCCRKTTQANFDTVQQSCITNEESSNDNVQSSTYKIDYPISDIPNQKIMNRRILLPEYVINILGIKSIVANGTIMSSHGQIRDGINPNIKSYLQTATIIAAIAKSKFDSVPVYKTYREFIIDVIATAKQPYTQNRILNHRILNRRYPTPQSFISAIEEHFIRVHKLEPISQISSVEWNDIIIFIANCMGLNVLLLYDDRNATSGLTITNLEDIDPTKPVVCILKRINIEWSIQNNNTRALYLPITETNYKVIWKSDLVIPRLDISKHLSKITKVTLSPMLKQLSKTLHYDRVQSFVESRTSMKLSANKSKNVGMVTIDSKFFITTLSPLTELFLEDDDFHKTTPTASFLDLLTFIREYNLHTMDDTDNIKSKLKSYKQYIDLALKTDKYNYIELDAFVLRISKLIECKNKIIGAIVNVMNDKQIINTELMFIKPMTITDVESKLVLLKQELLHIKEKTNITKILTFPVMNSLVDSNTKSNIVNWMINPLTIEFQDKHPVTCSRSTDDAYSKGMYMQLVYGIFTKEILTLWMAERPSDLIKFIQSLIKKAKTDPPFSQNTIDEFMDVCISKHKQYDPNVFRVTLFQLFDNINSFSRTKKDSIDAVESFSLFIGFDLKNVYRLTKDEIKEKIQSLSKKGIVITHEYPRFKMDGLHHDNIVNMYDPKSNKLLMHESVEVDLIQFLVDDLKNPFRRDYVLNFNATSEAIDNNMNTDTNEIVHISEIM